MSRSYKKHLVCKQRNDSYTKHLCSRRIRRKMSNNLDLEVSNCKYKKLFSSYEICDWADFSKIGVNPLKLNYQEKRWYYLK